MSIYDHMNTDDFIMVIRPLMQPAHENTDSAEGDWTGNVQVSIIADPANSALEKEDFTHMITLCNCVAASIPAMEENGFVREILEAYAHNRMLNPTYETLFQDDNVLQFSTDTEGNA
tara:strand:- start:2786 stop:3136 length:351 start_codon:yes stop_codon:yes gene_type:complete